MYTQHIKSRFAINIQIIYLELGCLPNVKFLGNANVECFQLASCDSFVTVAAVCTVQLHYNVCFCLD